MYKRKKISVIVPVHNEERGIGLTCKLIPKFIDEIIVVDNLSTDNTVRIARKLKVKVISEKNKGI